MTGGLKFYFDFLSHPSRSLYIILKLSGIQCETIPISLENGENYTEEYKKINRFQKVPAIVEGDLHLAESIAILRYLHHTKRISETLYPSDAEGSARVDEFLDWQHLGIRREGFVYFRFKWMEPLLTGKPTPEGKLEKFKKNFEEQLDILDKTWLASTKFVTGDNMNVADIFGACELQQSKMAHYDMSRNYPKIAEWMENVRERTNPVFDEAHQIVYTYSKLPESAKL